MNKSGKVRMRGVSWSKSKSRYCSSIKVKGKYIHLYQGKSAVDAIRKRLLAEKRYFGFVVR